MSCQPNHWNMLLMEEKLSPQVIFYGDLAKSWTLFETLKRWSLYWNRAHSAPKNIKQIYGMFNLVINIAHCHDCGFFILMRYVGDKDVQAALKVIFEIVWCTFEIALSIKLEKKQSEDLPNNIQDTKTNMHSAM